MITIKPLVSRGIADHFFVEKVRRTDPFFMDDNHLHDECEFFLLTEGSAEYYIENEKFEVNEGDLVVLNKNILHRTTYSPDQPHERFLIEFNKDVILKEIDNSLSIELDSFLTENSKVISLTHLDYNSVKTIFQSILDETQQKKSNHELMVSMKLAEMIIIISRYSTVSQATDSFNRSIQSSSREELITSILKYVHENLTEDLSLESIAAHFFIDKSYLSRIFKEITHFTVSEYINVERIKLAKLYLVKTDFSIEAIAHKVGYNYLSYFIKTFKKHTEMTPLQYRKREIITLRSVRPVQLSD